MDTSVLAKANLTDRELNALAAYYFDGESQPDIAARMGVDQSTVSRLIDSGRDKLAVFGWTPKRCKRAERPTIETWPNERLDRLPAPSMN